MNNYDLRDILDYAKRHNLMQKPLIEVVNMWNEEFEKAYKES